MAPNSASKAKVWAASVSSIRLIGEADMHENPIADTRFDRVLVIDDAGEMDLTTHAGDVDDPQHVVSVADRDDLPGNA
jgi:hypothetical protein